MSHSSHVEIKDNNWKTLIKESAIEVMTGGKWNTCYNKKEKTMKMGHSSHVDTKVIIEKLSLLMGSTINVMTGGKWNITL